MIAQIVQLLPTAPLASHAATLGRSDVRSDADAERLATHDACATEDVYIARAPAAAAAAAATTTATTTGRICCHYATADCSASTGEFKALLDKSKMP